MRLSVVVVSYNDARLGACLEALSRQPDVTEIVVSDCSAVDPSLRWQTSFPRVRFLHWPERRSVPRLRWAGVRETSGDLVAAIEARTIPDSTWAARLVAAHQAHPDAPVVGGAVAPAAATSVRDDGLYFCEYGRFSPPVRCGAADELSGANLSYLRAALDEAADVITEGRWETALHERWRHNGRQLIQSDAIVTFQNAMDTSTIVKQRFSYGRAYAAARFNPRSFRRRFTYALLSPSLPLVLTWRTARHLAGHPLSARFWRSLPWTMLFNSAWAAGECVGYLRPGSGVDAIF